MSGNCETAIGGMIAHSEEHKRNVLRCMMKTARPAANRNGVQGVPTVARTSAAGQADTKCVVSYLDDVLAIGAMYRVLVEESRSC